MCLVREDSSVASSPAVLATGAGGACQPSVGRGCDRLPPRASELTDAESTIKTTELYAFTNEEAKREASKNALI